MLDGWATGFMLHLELAESTEASRPYRRCFFFFSSPGIWEMLPESPLHGAIRGSHNCSCYPGQIWENEGEHTEIPNLSCIYQSCCGNSGGPDGCLCILRYTSGLDQWGVECLLLVGLLRLCCTWLVSAMSRQRCDSKVQAITISPFCISKLWYSFLAFCLADYWIKEPT